MAATGYLNVGLLAFALWKALWMAPTIAPVWFRSCIPSIAFLWPDRSLKAGRDTGPETGLKCRTGRQRCGSRPGTRRRVDALNQINGLVKAKRLGPPFKEVELVEIAPVTPAGFFNFFIERKRVYDLAFEEAVAAFAARGPCPAKVA
jgi:hypothetical protein